MCSRREDSVGGIAGYNTVWSEGWVAGLSEEERAVDESHVQKVSGYFGAEKDRLCALVVRVPGYRCRDPGSIPCATRFFREVLGLEVWNAGHSIS
jgi:hypothetical protein